MKASSLLFFGILFPFFGLTQETVNSISLIGGGEYHDEETTSWNIELNYNRQIGSSKFFAEFGLNYSIQEYTRDQRFPLYGECGPYQSLSLGAISIPYNGYYQSSMSHYEQIQSIRLQAGVNYRIIETEQFQLSGGVNFVNQFVTKVYDHGQYVYFSEVCADSLPTWRGTYSSDRGRNIDYDKLSILLQPHIDASIALSPKWSLTSRLSYYWRVLPRVQHSRVQLNVGVKYSW
ncbi:MAG: hypothetical protein AB8B56_16065 [Crocinitomicaceae bacterium]